MSLFPETKIFLILDWQMSSNNYKPTFSDEYARKLRQWQDNVYQESKGRRTQHAEFLGLRLNIPPTVHPINPMSDLLGGSVLKEVKKKDKVLDMGTGSGVNALLAASITNSVLAVDINPEAIKAAIQNAKVNGVDSRISFRTSDVFSQVKETFDLIIFDPPFRWFRPRDIYEVSTTDEGYKASTAFFAEADNHLNTNGRILICFGTSGDLDYLNQLIHKHKFTSEVIAHRSLKKEGIEVDYYTFRLTKL
jgi:release factor glutamine methyltransferase